MSRPPHRLRAWLGGIAIGMLLLVFGQFVYEVWVVGVRQYQVLLFVDQPYGDGGPAFEVFIDGKPARFTFGVHPSDGAFALLLGAGPVRSTKERVTLELVPQSKNPAYRIHRFEVENSRKDPVCDAVVEVRGAEPTFLGCSGRAYNP